jgi:putative redox protein
MNKVSLNFNNTFNGELTASKTTAIIGEGHNALSPYEMLAGALGSCLYSTFLEIIKKMRLNFDTCKIDIEIEKRTEVPATAKLVLITCIIKGATNDNIAKYNRAFSLATEHCSIYNTVSQVAEMKWTLALEA